MERVEVEETDSAAELRFSARHPLLMIVVLVPGLPVLLGLVALLLHKLMSGDLLNLLGTAALTGLVAYAIAHIGLRSRAYSIRLSAAGVEANGVTYGYDGIESYGISGTAIPAYDVVSAPLPRNTAFGQHLYLRYRGGHVPITVGLPKAEARALLQAFEPLFARFAPDGGRPV